MSSRWNENGEVPRGEAYDERFARLAARGVDVHGEASFVERYAPRRVLDAGCGTGRVAIELARRGVEVVGVDLDPAMLGRAREQAPDQRWVLADLAELGLRDDDGAPSRFDVVVAPGNVLIFVAPGTEAIVVDRLAAHVAPGGHLVCGFQLRPGAYALEDYDQHARDAGLERIDRFSTWDGDPFVAGGDYVVTVDQRV